MNAGQLKKILASIDDNAPVRLVEGNLSADPSRPNVLTTLTDAATYIDGSLWLYGGKPLPFKMPSKTN